MSKSTLPPAQDRFHSNVVKMTGLIKSIVIAANSAGYKDVHPVMVDVAEEYVKNNFNKEELIRSFIQHSHPPLPNGTLDHGIWDKILAKDEAFFQDKAFDIFKSLPPGTVDAFKRLVNYKDNTGKSIMSPSKKEELIAYFHAYVKISIKYIHLLRKPIIKSGGTGYYYQEPNVFKGIDVLRHAKNWNVQLEFSQT